MVLVGVPLTIAPRLAGLEWPAAVLAGSAGAFSSTVVVRCRFESFGSRLLRAGATAVVSEEAEAAGPLLSHCERLIERAN